MVARDWRRRDLTNHPEGQPLPKIEQIEIEAHRDAIDRDVRHLVEKYRAIFDWDVPDVDQTAADTLILSEVALAVEVLKRDLLTI